MGKFSLSLCVIGLVLAAFLLIFGDHPGRALVGVPIFVCGLVGYFRGEYTAPYEQREVERNTESAKTSGLSRLRNR
jgi:hypothetical protein